MENTLQFGYDYYKQKGIHKLSIDDFKLLISVC